MLFSGWSRVLLGASLLTVGTGLSAGGVILFTRNSNSETSVITKEVSEDKSISETSVSTEETALVTDTAQQDDPKTSVGGEAQNVAETSGNLQQSVQQEKKCTIYKIMDKSKKTTTKANEDFLGKEVKIKSSTYKEISKACEEAKGRDIFVSQKNVGYWWLPIWEWSYDKSEQNNGWIIG